MLRITFPTFIDYLAARGPSKIVKVRAAKKMVLSPDRYKLIDHYLAIRRATQDSFARGGDKAVLRRCVENLDDAKKVEGYTEIVTGLSKFIGRRKITALSVPGRTWKSGDLHVSVKPEFVLEIGGDRFVAVVYWKSERLDQHRVNPMLHLLGVTHGAAGRPMILEARTGKTYEVTRRVRGLDPFLAAEAQSFVALWNSDLDAA